LFYFYTVVIKNSAIVSENSTILFCNCPNVSENSTIVFYNRPNVSQNSTIVSEDSTIVSENSTILEMKTTKTGEKPHYEWKNQNFAYRNFADSSARVAGDTLVEKKLQIASSPRNGWHLCNPKMGIPVQDGNLFLNCQLTLTIIISLPLFSIEHW